MNETNTWFEFAKQDLQMAKLALGESIYNQVCFHSQQAVEKLIKGVIDKSKTLPPRTHKIADLIVVAKLNISIELAAELVSLDRFYIPTRYPNALPGMLPYGLPSEKDANEALAVAKNLFEAMDVE